MKVILDTIALDEVRKKELIRGDAVDKAEQLSKLFYSNAHVVCRKRHQLISSICIFLFKSSYLSRLK